MATQQGSLALLDHPVAQQLLQSTLPARLAYNWSDGTPRVVPIWFHWNGQEIVLGTPPDAPKMKVLRDGAKVALTIDSDSMPYKVLLIRGSVHIDTVEGISPEYGASGRRVLGEDTSTGELGDVVEHPHLLREEGRSAGQAEPGADEPPKQRRPGNKGALAGPRGSEHLA